MMIVVFLPLMASQKADKQRVELSVDDISLALQGVSFGRTVSTSNKQGKGSQDNSIDLQRKAQAENAQPKDLEEELSLEDRRRIWSEAVVTATKLAGSKTAFLPTGNTK